jgi:hypothetical protein
MCEDNGKLSKKQWEWKGLMEVVDLGMCRSVSRKEQPKGAKKKTESGRLHASMRFPLPLA